MTCGFQVLYGYTESDEISLLFALNENAFSRKHRKYNSILAGEASAKFTSLLGAIGTFDCRISELPNKSLVTDYFRWRNEDAFRNALNAHCYWRLRAAGRSQDTATNAIKSLSTADKNELLFSHGINFNELPSWQKRGIGLYWKTVDKAGVNPITGHQQSSTRRQLVTDYELPMKQAYSNFILDLVNCSELQSL
jgi:tRNA(His) 5'-end guanylyltransferase